MGKRPLAKENRKVIVQGCLVQVLVFELSMCCGCHTCRWLWSLPR